MKNIKYCKNHPDKPVKSMGLCKNCYEKDLKSRNPEYAKNQKENSKNWHIKNKEKKSIYDKKYRKLNKSDGYKKYLSSIKLKFNISKEEYENLLKSCNNCCMLCNKPPYENKRLHLDHCHKTGKVRGLLCARCNWYLHTVEKDITILDKIKNYLEIE